jgi:pyruvate formate lyase activating enzyme
MNSSDLSGRVHSLETLGAVDGPGLRLVVFLQGCPLRCRYCHNPDTWAASGGQVLGVEELVRRARRYEPYFGTAGGVTLSGGEPLFQPAFVSALLQALQASGISTALDTCGWLPAGRSAAGLLDPILKSADLVILDIKSPDQSQFRWLTSRAIRPLIRFLGACQANRKTLRIRQVIVPGWNDQPSDIEKLIRFLANWPGLRIEIIELLPYHTLGITKWRQLGLSYSLGDLKPLRPADLHPLQALADQLLVNLS